MHYGNCKLPFTVGYYKEGGVLFSLLIKYIFMNPALKFYNIKKMKWQVYKILVLLHNGGILQRLHHKTMLA
jgi:hypothetical protein